MTYKSPLAHRRIHRGLSSQPRWRLSPWLTRQAVHSLGAPRSVGRATSPVHVHPIGPAPGCTERRVLAKIVLPLTKPVLFTGAILVTINVWGDYLWVTIVIQDPHKTTISAGVQQFVSSFGLNVSSGGSVFAAFVIATVPMFVLVGFTMRYFVSGLTQGATKL